MFRYFWTVSIITFELKQQFVLLSKNKDLEVRVSEFGGADLQPCAGILSAVAALGRHCSTTREQNPEVSEKASSRPNSLHASPTTADVLAIEALSHPARLIIVSSS
jgi:hypothetical protein